MLKHLSLQQEHEDRLKELRTKLFGTPESANNVAKKVESGMSTQNSMENLNKVEVVRIILILILEWKILIVMTQLILSDGIDQHP